MRKRDAVIASANADADRALNALDIVEAMLNDGNAEDGPKEVRISHSDGLFPVEGNGSAPPRKAYPTARWIAEIVNELPGPLITQPIVFNELVKRHPEAAGRSPKSVRAQVAVRLRNMAERGDLVLDVEAHGTHPAEYRKTDGTAPNVRSLVTDSADGETAIKTVVW